MVQVKAFKEDSRILKRWKRNSNNYNTSTAPVLEVQAFAKSSATDPHQNRALFWLIRLLNRLLEIFDSFLELCFI